MAVQAKRHESDIPVEPHAIIWRKIEEYSTCLYRSKDDLDEFVGASFSSGNALHFDIRRYNEHPAHTCTLYLPIELKTLGDIRSSIREISSILVIPGYAVAWRRGEQFRYGHLERLSNDRLRESEARVLALKIASQCPNRYASTEFIKSKVPDYYPLSPTDLKPSPTRRAEQHWQQIVRNVISHQSNPLGPFRMGYAVREDDGLRVTDEGVDYLNSIGFFCE